jgi:hypothetical protein
MQDIDEGIIDYLKKLWQSLTGKFKPSTPSPVDGEDKLHPKDNYHGVDDIKSSDPDLKKKLAKVFVRGLRLHKEAQKFGVHDEELFQILTNVWNGKITLSDFFKLKINGELDRIYARVRERVRYKRKKAGIWHEQKK